MGARRDPGTDACCGRLPADASCHRTHIPPMFTPRIAPRWAAFGLALGLTVPALAQTGLTLNPQAGVSVLRLNQAPAEGVETNARAGYLLGLDARIGHRFYVQPGVYYANTRTLYGLSDSVAVNREAVGRSALRFRAQAGYRILDGEHANLRVALGPAYDLILAYDTDDTELFEDVDFGNGQWALDASVGADLYFVSLEVGYTHGLSGVFADDGAYRPDTRYRGFYATAGIVFGVTEGQ